MVNNNLELFQYQISSVLFIFYDYKSSINSGLSFKDSFERISCCLLQLFASCILSTVYYILYSVRSTTVPYFQITDFSKKSFFTWKNLCLIFKLETEVEQRIKIYRVKRCMVIDMSRNKRNPRIQLTFLDLFIFSHNIVKQLNQKTWSFHSKRWQTKHEFQYFVSFSAISADNM